jgi:hypothetical protein
LQAAWERFPFKRQANSMNQKLDERTREDLRDIASRRGFTAAHIEVLADNVAGVPRLDHGYDRDRDLRTLASALSVAFMCSRHQPSFDPGACAVEVVVMGRQKLEAHCSGHDGVFVTGEGLAVDAGGLKFKAGWAMIEDALALAEFIVMNEDRLVVMNGGRGLEFKDAVSALYNAADPAAGIKAAVRILSRQMHLFRETYLPNGGETDVDGRGT